MGAAVLRTILGFGISEIEQALKLTRQGSDRGDSKVARATQSMRYRSFGFGFAVHFYNYMNSFLFVSFHEQSKLFWLSPFSSASYPIVGCFVTSHLLFIQLVVRVYKTVRRVTFYSYDVWFEFPNCSISIHSTFGVCFQHASLSIHALVW